MPTPSPSARAPKPTHAHSPARVPEAPSPAASAAAPVWHRHHPSPLGPLWLAADDAGLRLIEFPDSRHRATAGPHWQAGDHPLLRETAAQLDAYFAGRLRQFDLPLAAGLAQGTPFQQQVWQALRAVPYATTCSYADLARAIERPQAMRAVGAANGRNPLPIVVPCHRVIGRDGSLTGFGGGLPAKQWLLAHEVQVAHREGR